MIQVVTFLSPILGGHLHRMFKESRFHSPSPKKAQAELPGPGDSMSENSWMYPDPNVPLFGNPYISPI